MGGLKGLLGRLPGPLSNVLSHNGHHDGGLRTVKEQELFAKTTPEVDGQECLHDCATCDIKYPAKFSIEESAQLYGHIKAWDRHILVATGKSDWKHTVSDEKGSIAEALDKHASKINHGSTKITTSNMPVPPPPRGSEHGETTTRILVLPAFLYIDNVTPSNTAEAITTIINNTSGNDEPISSTLQYQPTVTSTNVEPDLLNLSISPSGTTSFPQMTISSCPHDYLVLLCSHKTRDARCGQSAPLIKRELERHLRPLGLVRDLDDDRPGGVGIYFISHVGGHKFAANVFVYRRAGTPGTLLPHTLENGVDADADATMTTTSTSNSNGVNGSTTTDSDNSATVAEAGAEQQQTEIPVVEAAQCIWLARIKPEDCENLVRYTILQGKVVKPETQLRGGFDRCRQLASW